MLSNACSGISLSLLSEEKVISTGLCISLNVYGSIFFIVLGTLIDDISAFKNAEAEIHSTGYLFPFFTSSLGMSILALGSVPTYFKMLLIVES